MQTITITTESGEVLEIKVKGKITVDGKPLTPPVKEKQYPWEKSFERVCVNKDVFFVDLSSSIEGFVVGAVDNRHKNTVPSKSIALSVLAYTQLKVITTDMNGTPEMLTPEMNGGVVFAPAYNLDDKIFEVTAHTGFKESPFPVRTDELCQQLIDENTELLEQFYEIKK